MKASSPNPQQQDDSLQRLEHLILEGILDKKGEAIVSLDLRKLTEAMTSKMIICEATSKPKVKAIADNVQINVKKKSGEYPMKTEGMQNAEWVLIDYFDIIVHVFLREQRNFYQLEELWSDAEFTHYEDDHKLKKVE